MLTRRSQDHALGFTQAFADGLARHGWKITCDLEYRRCDLLVMWGVRQQDLIDKQKQRGDEVCIVERGYVEDRFSYASVSFGGGLNGRGVFRGPLHDPARWESKFAHLMKPWIHGTHGHVLIMGQVEGDAAVRGVRLPDFYDQARAAFSGFNVRFRPHPHGQKIPGPSLADDLAGARCVVTWNSNSGVDAVLAGVPTVAMDQGSMAWDVTGHELKMPRVCERESWAHALAWKQWTKEEMSSGYCWDMVKG